ncbi:hypothetical protein ACWOBX_08365 [Facklamia languida]
MKEELQPYLKTIEELTQALAVEKLQANAIYFELNKKITEVDELNKKITELEEELEQCNTKS